MIGEPALRLGRDTDGPAAPLVTLEPAPVLILEGVYSARPELADLVNLVGLRALLDVLEDVRRSSAAGTGGEEYRSDGEARWTAAEEWYFGTVMPPEAFDLMLR